MTRRTFGKPQKHSPVPVITTATVNHRQQCIAHIIPRRRFLLFIHRRLDNIIILLCNITCLNRHNIEDVHIGSIDVIIVYRYTRKDNNYK